MSGTSDSADGPPIGTGDDAERAEPGRLRGVPELPPHYLPRPEEITRLERALLGEADKLAITGVAKHGLHGMGGIGKSVLAAALARRIAPHFADGVLWLTVGEAPQLEALQAQIARELGRPEAFSRPLAGRARLRDLFAGYQLLLVLDDVWEVEQIEMLDVTGERGRLLVTTRDRRVLAHLERCQEHCLDVLSRHEAIALLASWAGHARSRLPGDAELVARMCGRLPLALAMIGAMVRADLVDWADALELLGQADLAEIEHKFPGYPYHDMLRAMGVSVRALSPNLRALYLDLAVFPEDAWIPEEVLRLLWDLSGARTRKRIRELDARSLVVRDDVGRVRLHDLQRMYLRGNAADLPGLHSRLVDAYAPRCVDGLARGPRDSNEASAYYYEWLPYHLHQAGRQNELRWLLTNYDWIDGKLRATGAAPLIADYAYLADDPVLTSIRDVLRLSSHVLTRDPKQLPSQIIGRFGQHADRDDCAPAMHRLLDQARSEARFSWLCPLRPNLTAPGGPLVRSIPGHDYFILDVAITPDGDRALSAARDHAVKVWDLETGRELLSLVGHSGWVHAVVVTPDGKRAVTASLDRTLRVWDLELGRELRTLAGHGMAVNGVAVLPDGARALSASRDRTLKLWDLHSGAELLTLHGHTSMVNAVAVTPDGGRAISASDDHTLKVWDLATGELLHDLHGHADSVHAVAVTEDGRRAVSAAWDKTLKVWDIVAGRCVRTLTGHQDDVNTVAVIPGEARIVSGSWDHTLRIWDLDSGDELHMLHGRSGAITSVVVTPDGRRGLSASWDRQVDDLTSSIQVWDLGAVGRSFQPVGHTSLVSAIVVLPGRKQAISTSWDATSKVWSLESCDELHTLRGHAGQVHSVAVTADGERAVSASGDHTLKVWSITGARELHTLRGHANEVEVVAVGPDGKQAISGSMDHRLKVWDLDSGAELHTLRGHENRVLAAVVTPDGRRAVSGSRDGTARVWDLDSGRELHALIGHENLVRAIAVTADGTRAVTASWDHTLKVWDLDSGRELRTLIGHTNVVHAVVVLEDGKRAVSASWDRTLKVWDLDSGQLLATLHGHSHRIGGLAVLPGGARLLSMSDDWTLRIWAIDSSREVASFIGEGEPMNAVAHDADTGVIIAGDGGGRVHFLRLVAAGALALESDPYHGARSLEDLFDAALDVPADARAAFLDRICAGDIALRRNVEALLAADRGLGTPSAKPPRVVLDALADEDTGLSPGTQVDRYTLIRRLGKGGMGTVHLARDTKLQRSVAIKFLHVDSAELAQRFIREARLTARCRHENIVVIHDMGEYEGRPYMVLELLEGTSLRDEIAADAAGAGVDVHAETVSSGRGGDLDWRSRAARATRIALPVVHALAYAHEHGIVHRDLKPENIFVTHAHAVKVLDFGIAKAVAEVYGSHPTVAPSRTERSLDESWTTQTGMLVGTPAYMAPEQWNRGVIDPQTDLWSVGVILYELVTGRHPLAPLSASRLREIAEVDRPMPGLRERLPVLGEFGSLVDRCLQKRKAERMPSARELKDALESILPPPAAPEPG